MIVPVFPFVQMPLGGMGMQVCHPFTRKRGGAYGQEQFQAFDHNLTRLRHTTRIQPQNAKSQSSVN